MRAYTLGALLVALPGISACFGGSAVEPARAVDSLQMLPAAASVKVGSTVNMVASALDANGGAVYGKTYVWTTQDTALVESRPGGVFFGKNVGVAAVTAIVDGIKGNALMTVTP